MQQKIGVRATIMGGGIVGISVPCSNYLPSSKNDRVNPNALVGSFADADGAIAGEPFKIGTDKIVEIPKDALAIAAGVNPGPHICHRGRVRVVIDTGTPVVTVELPPGP